MPGARAPALYRALPYIGLAATALIWSAATVVAKMLLSAVEALDLVLLRYAITGSLVFTPVFFWTNRGPQRFRASEWPRLLALGVIGCGGSHALYILGLEHAPADEAALLQLTTPLFVVLAAVWLFNERLPRARILGLLISCVGAVVLVVANSGPLGGGDALGRLLLTASALSWGLYTLVSKELMARRSPLLVVAAANMIAMFAAVTLAGPERLVATVASMRSWATPTWLQFGFMLVLANTSCHWLYVRCLRVVPAGQATAFQYLQPPITMLLAAALIDERPTILTLACGAVILAGLWLLNRPLSEHRARPRASWPEPGASPRPTVEQPPAAAP
ncbi:MAG: DMT family transporter [Chloroflexi bacterium]|nr:DMT family transporter [Chloroflexota bacterium]